MAQQSQPQLNVYRERRRRKRRGPRAEGQLPNQKQHGALGMLSRPLGGACPLLLLPWARGAERQARLPQGRSSLQTGEGVGTTRPQFLGQPDTRQVSERRVRCPGRNKTERGNGGETGLSQHWGQRSENHQQLSKKKRPVRYCTQVDRNILVMGRVEGRHLTVLEVRGGGTCLRSGRTNGMR